MTDTVQIKVNGQIKRFKVDGDRALLWVLRTDLGLTGTKYGCGEGHCGACTVLVDQEAVLSCQTTIGEVDGAEIVTIEGLAENGTLHPIQKAFVKHGGMQCGFCTPGMILRAYSLLSEKSHPSRQEIIEGMEDNLCRCGAHVRIIQAVESVAREMKGGMK